MKNNIHGFTDNEGHVTCHIFILQEDGSVKHGGGDCYARSWRINTLHTVVSMH